MEDVIAAILRSATPLIYVTLGGVLAQRAGIWNLGLEGLMITGACAAVLGVANTGSLAIAMTLAISVPFSTPRREICRLLIASLPRCLFLVAALRMNVLY